MRFAAIALMAGQLVGSPLSAVPAHAWTADSLAGAPAAQTRQSLEPAAEWAALATNDAAPGSPGAAETDPARAGDVTPFPVVEVPPSNGHRHRGALISAVTGLGLIGASFAWQRSANRRYDDYLSETDPDAIESRWNAVVRADRLSTSSLIAGELLLATAVYLRFVRASQPRVALAVAPSRAAVAVRW